MTVYVAEPKDYRKIVKFLAEQPKETLPARCFRSCYEVSTVDDLERMKEEMAPIEYFIAEDKRKKVRGILIAQGREEVKIATYTVIHIDHDDWEKEDRTYFNELIDFALRFAYNEYGYLKGDFFAIEKIGDWIKSLCGDTMEIIDEMDTSLGKVYRFLIDIKGYAS